MRIKPAVAVLLAGIVLLVTGSACTQVAPDTRRIFELELAADHGREVQQYIIVDVTVTPKVTSARLELNGEEQKLPFNGFAKNPVKGTFRVTRGDKFKLDIGLRLADVWNAKTMRCRISDPLARHSTMDSYDVRRLDDRMGCVVKVS